MGGGPDRPARRGQRPMTRLRQLLRKANPGRLGVYLLALWKLFKHPDTPRPARWLAVAVLAYALSPIDLIPDFIPVIGLLDDIVLVPLGVALVIRLTPRALWQERLREAEQGGEALPRLLWGAAIVIGVWLLVAGLFAGWMVWLAKGAWW